LKRIHKLKIGKSALNAQGSRLIIIVVHIRAVKIYVAVVEELRKDRMKLNLPPKLMAFSVSPPPPLNANVLFCTFF
jgi:hypothetical protein